MLSKEAVEEFKQIWKSEIGSDITDEEALQYATSLITLVGEAYKAIPRPQGNQGLK